MFHYTHPLPSLLSVRASSASRTLKSLDSYEEIPSFVCTAWRVLRKSPRTSLRFPRTPLEFQVIRSLKRGIRISLVSSISRYRGGGRLSILIARLTSKSGIVISRGFTNPNLSLHRRREGREITSRPCSRRRSLAYQYHGILDRARILTLSLPLLSRSLANFLVTRRFFHRWKSENIPSRRARGWSFYFVVVVAWWRNDNQIATELTQPESSC